jgi:hypothetical protein
MYLKSTYGTYRFLHRLQELFLRLVVVQFGHYVLPFESIPLAQEIDEAGAVI